MSAYKDTKTGKWVAQLRYKDWQGNAQRKLKRGFNTKREALEWEREYLRKKTGSLDMSFEQFVELYLENIEPRVKPDTYDMKKGIISTRIVPYFKDKSVSDITSNDIIQWQNTLLAKKNSSGKVYKKSYLKTIHNQISAIFNYAVRYYGLPENPARIAGNMGTEKEIKIEFWTPEEYKQFAEAVMDKPLSYYIFEVLYWAGLRLGEMLALTKEDIDLNNRTISVNKTYYKLGGQEYITTPKTAKSIRVVTMPDFLADELEEYMRAIPDLEDTERLFPISKYYVQNEMKRGCKMAGVKRIHVHALRHSHVSLLAGLNYSAVSIAERMGHESIDITYRYAHMFPSVQNDMANSLQVLRKEDDYYG